MRNFIDGAILAAIVFFPLGLKLGADQQAASQPPMRVEHVPFMAPNIPYPECVEICKYRTRETKPLRKG